MEYESRKYLVQNDFVRGNKIDKIWVMYNDMNEAKNRNSSPTQAL